MATLPRRTAPLPPPQAEGANFGSLDWYSRGGGLPEDDYVWKDIDVRMHQSETKAGVKKGPERLTVMITLVNRNDPSQPEIMQPYSMGTKAHLSWAPNPATGKGIVPVPGGPTTPLNHASNWALLLKSLYDAGLPQGVFTNDLSVFEGMHVHMQNVPEPEERKTFRQNSFATGDVEEQQTFQGSGMVAVVGQIFDDGKPWEGTGGMPDTAPAKPAAKAPAKVAPINKKAAAPPPPPVEESDGADLAVAAQSGFAAVLGEKPAGCPRLALQTGTFKYVAAEYGNEMAQAVQETYFTASDAAEQLGVALGEIGYQVVGAMVKPLA